MLNRWRDSGAIHLRALPLYAAVWAAMASGFTAYFSLLNATNPLLLAFALSAVGLGVGVALRKKPQWRMAGLIVGAIVIGTLVQFTPFGDTEGQTDFLLQIPFYIAWAALVLCWGSCTDDTALFLLVPSVALIIASGSQSQDDTITGCVLVFCAMALFALFYHSQLRDESDAHGSSLKPRQLALNQLTLAGITFIAACVLALAAMVPFQIVGQAVRPILTGTMMALRRRVPNRAAHDASLAGVRTTLDTVKVGQGPIQPTGEPVMVVQSPERHYLRSRVYTDYLGSGWKDAADSPGVSMGRAGVNAWVGPDVYTSHWRVEPQQIRMLEGTDFLPGYAQLATVHLGTSSTHVVLDTHGCAHLSRAFVDLIRYSVTSRVPPDFDGLTDGPAGLPAPAPPPQRVVPAELSLLAARLKGSTDIETTRNIVGFLQSHCTYDLNAPAVPPDRDAVDFFLFDSRAGYCDLFATSAAVLLQLGGVPARYCTGYLPGEWSSEYNGDLVTAEKAHAWVEVFIQGRGWITVDPTPPGFSGPPSVSVRVRGLFSRLHLGPLAFSFPLCLALLSAGIACYLLYNTFPAVLRRRAAHRLAMDNLGSRLVANYWTMQQILRRKRLDRLPYETPFEHCQRLRESALPPEGMDAVADLTEAFVALRYGNKVPTDDHAANLQSLRETLRRRRG